MAKQRSLVRKLILSAHEYVKPPSIHMLTPIISCITGICLHFRCAHFRSQRTAVYYHEDCLRHATPAYHQESPERLTAIMAKLRNVRIFDKHELHEVPYCSVTCVIH